MILSGSHASVYEEIDRCRADAVFELGVPVLGICYGMQTMAQQLGGKVSGHQREFGYAEVRAHGHTALLKDIAGFATPMAPGMLKVWMSHGDKVTELPKVSRVVAASAGCRSREWPTRRAFYAGSSTRGHPHRPRAALILRRFVRDICAEPTGPWRLPRCRCRRSRAGRRRSRSQACRAASIRRSRQH